MRNGWCDAPNAVPDHVAVSVTDLGGSVYSARLDGSERSVLLFGQGQSQRYRLRRAAVTAQPKRGEPRVAIDTSGSLQT